MGQYHLPVNLDKREYLNPHRMGDGLKLMEQALSGPGGTGSGLLLLLAASNGESGRGGGDFHPEGYADVIGRWAGDRVALVGDYAEPEDLPESPVPSHLVYDLCNDADDVRERANHMRERAEQYEKYALDATPEQRQKHLDAAGLLRADAAYLDAAEPFADVTERVKAAIVADGYMQYDASGGFVRRVEPGFEPEPAPTGHGQYLVRGYVDQGDLAGAYVSVKWECNHYRHAENRARKRGIAEPEIEYLGPLPA